MRGQHVVYSPAELEWLAENRTFPISEYHQQFVAVFRRPDVTAANLHSLRKRRGWKTGRTGHFTKGSESWNKGQSYTALGSEKGWFKKGRLPHNTKFLGHERLGKIGYIEISVAETNPHTGYERRYVLKHVLEWETANGPIPEGHCLKCLGDRTNTDPSNWELIPRAILPRLNGGRHKRHLAVDEAAPELRPTIIAMAKVAHQARRLRKGGA